jgi:hypothetical protein
LNKKSTDFNPLFRIETAGWYLGGTLEERVTELRSWVQLPPGPFFLAIENYGIKLSLF